MLADIKIGQYFPGKSILHKLDPRFKLVALMVLLLGLFIFDNIPSYLVWTGFVVLLMP